MTKEFSLEAILTFTIGISCVDNYRDAFELAWFVFGDPGINTAGILVIEEPLKKHLLSLYPQLKDVKYNQAVETSFKAWLISVKSEFGEKLPVCRINETLEEMNHIGSR